MIRLGKGKRNYSILAGVLALIAVALIVTKYGVFSRQTENIEYLENAYDGDTIYKGVKGTGSDSDRPVFRKNAKFKILEIVPSRCMAEIGYGIDGEQPIDFGNPIKRVDWDKDLSQLGRVLGTDGKDGPTEADKTVFMYKKIDDQEGIVVNNSLFISHTLKGALELSDNEVKSYITNRSVDVLVVEPDQINADISLISQADYIYIHNNFSNGETGFTENIIRLYGKYSKEYKGKTFPDIGKPVFKGSNDLSWDTVKALYEYSAIGEMPLTLQGCALDNTPTTNFQKLGVLYNVGLYYKTNYDLNLEKINYLLAEPDFETKGVKALDPTLTHDGWGYEAIAKYFKDNYVGSTNNSGQSKDYQQDKSIMDDHKAKINDNGFVGGHDSTTVMTSAHGGGIQSFIIVKLGENNKADVSQEIKDKLKIKDDTLDVGIVIYNSLKPVFHVLDIEPDEPKDKDKLKISQIQKWLPKDFKCKPCVTTVTMSEFVGMVNDINANYDAIYLGKSIGKLVNGSAAAGGNKLYYKDIDAESSELLSYSYNSLSNSDFKYSGNDISMKKIQEIVDFMYAGYPVICEKALTNSAIVNTMNNMYSELVDKYRNHMYLSEDKEIESKNGSSLNKLMENDIVLGKPNIVTITEPLDYDEKENYSISTKSGLDCISFKLKRGEKDATYRAYLYVDTNHDGIYNSWENTGSSFKKKDGFEKPIFTSADFKVGDEVKVKDSIIPNDALLGVIPWKLEVVKLSGGSISGIRTNITGFVHYNLGNVNTIKVLHLGAVSDDAKNDGYRLLISENQTFKDLIESHVVNRDFKIVVEDKEIDSSLSDIDISQYQVFVVGFINEKQKQTNDAALLGLLSRAASKGKGIIFTNDALGYFNNESMTNHWGVGTNKDFRQLLHLDRFKICETAAPTEASKMGFCYAVLNKLSQSSINFEGINKDIKEADKIERVNDAKLGRYPFDILDKRNGFKTKSGVYQADVEEDADSPGKLGVAYYCLSNDSNGNTQYSVSPRDVRNNYYLWRYDNIFYSGITRESFTSEYEVKLFINTIISAYGLDRGIYVGVKNLPKTTLADGKEAYYLYANTDYDDTALEGSKDVEFYVKKSKVFSDKAKVRFYLADSNGNKVLDDEGNPIELQEKASGPLVRPVGVSASATVDTPNTIRLSNSGAESDQIVYKFKYSYKYLASASASTACNILIEAELVGDKNVKDEVLVRVIRRAMFDLD